MRHWLLTGLVFSAFGAAPVWGSSFLQMSVEELTPEARFVYRVRVLDEEVKSREDMPVRLFTLEVLEVFKGRHLEHPYTRVELPGGQVGDKGLHISGLPELTRDEEYILFLKEPLRDGEFRRLVGWTAYLVTEDQRGQRYVVQAPENTRRESDRSDIRAVTQVHSVDRYEEFVGKIFESRSR